MTEGVALMTLVTLRMIKLRVSSVSPAYGPASGGTQIVINGANFTSSATVTIGGHAATVVGITPTQIVAITPASTIGAAHITVTLSTSLAVTFAQGFTYLPRRRSPMIRSSPASRSFGRRISSNCARR
jgi:large repetitive protein